MWPVASSLCAVKKKGGGEQSKQEQERTKTEGCAIPARALPWTLPVLGPCALPSQSHGAFAVQIAAIIFVRR